MERKTEEMNFVEFVEKAKGQLEEYIDLRADILKANYTEKVAKAFSKLVTVVLLMILSFFAILFFSLFAGFYFGNMMGSVMQGFMIVALFYLLVLVAVILFRKNMIQTPVINSIIAIMYDDEA